MLKMSKENETITKYAITLTKATLRMHLNDATSIADKNEETKLTVEAGTLLKVFQTNTSGASKYNTVQVLDLESTNVVYENTLFECLQTQMRKVSEDLWPYLIGIGDAGRRLTFLQDPEHCRWVIYLKLNEIVNVCDDFYGKDSKIRYTCIIRYIGPVQELRAVGYCFGLELLNLEHGHSPQTEIVSFSNKYINCDPSLSIFTTADRILPLSSEAKKKFSAFDFVNSTVERVKSVIAPNSCVNGSTDTSTLKREKKYRKQEPTSYFYDTPITPSALVDDPFNAELDAGPVKFSPTSTMERRSQALKSKQNTNVTQVKVEPEPLITIESEDMKQTVENYEKFLERQHANNATTTHNNNNSDINNIPIVPPQPVGILKHRRNISNSDKDDVGNTSTKPSTYLSYEDRDIIIIDKADIQESTKHESSVVVVDKQRRQQEVDLADLLGSNWPTTAGDAAGILNKTSKPTTLNRNKSSNPLSHLGNSKSSQERGHRTADKTNLNITDGGSSGSASRAKKNNYDNIELPATLVPPPELDFLESSPLQEVPGSGLGVGSMVEVSIPEPPVDLYGVIRWIGVPPGAINVMVGVELEDEMTNKQLPTTDGSFDGCPLFKCQEGRALFVSPEYCTSDKRFSDADGAVGSITKTTNNNHDKQTDSNMFGQVECPSVAGAVAPLKILSLEDLDEICGKFKGIQGHHNSCYLDATLFSMFTFTCVFDSLLFRPPEADDIPHYTEVQKVLREEIVNPLRKNMFVRADRVMKLRKLLDKLSSVSGLMTEEKDPEEFMNSLLAQIMRVEPFLKLSSGQDAYFYQLFVEKDERLSFPSVQQLFEQSFHSSDIKLKEVPSCLIIQMPRFGKNYKMYPRILPSQLLDITDIIEDSPRQCMVCGKLAEFECPDCFGEHNALEHTAFCGNCLKTAHSHVKRSNHTSKKLSVPQDYRVMADHMDVPRLYMELFAVVCIETSHYVAFVKAGSGPDAPWCFFDSMADRKGEKNGYNIPEMITVPDMPQWLSEDGSRIVNETSSNDKMLPEHAKRLFCDAYMCMYQSSDVMMYR